MGVSPIRHTEIESWARLYGVDISPWEVSILDTLDMHYLKSVQSDSGMDDKSAAREISEELNDLEKAREAKRLRDIEKAKRKQGVT